MTRMDTGLHALVALAHFHQLPAEADQLAEQFGEPGQPFGVTQIMQAAKALTLKARRVQRALDDLDNAILPPTPPASAGVRSSHPERGSFRFEPGHSDQ